MCLFPPRYQIPSPLSFRLNGAEPRHVLHNGGIPATNGKADRVLEASCEEKGGEGRQGPLEPPVCVRGPSLSSLGLFTPTPVLLEQQSPLRRTANGKRQTRLISVYKIGAVQWVYHFHDQHDPRLHFPPSRGPI